MPKKIMADKSEFFLFIQQCNIPAIRYHLSLKKVDLTWTNKLGECALTVAMRTSNKIIAKMLLGAGINPNGQNKSVDEFTPLHWAVYLGDLVAINLLLKHGAKTNIKDMWGDTAFCIAKSMDLRPALELFKLQQEK